MDRERYATGFRLLDWLTEPYWKIKSWYVQRKFWQAVGIGNESWRETRDRLRRILVQCRCGLAKYAATDAEGNWYYYCEECDG